VNGSRGCVDDDIRRQPIDAVRVRNVNIKQFAGDDLSLPSATIRNPELDLRAPGKARKSPGFLVNLS